MNNEASSIWSSLNNRKGQFYTGFSYYMAGDLNQAILVFGNINGSIDKWRLAAKYWSGKAKQTLNLTNQAEIDFNSDAK